MKSKAIAISTLKAQQRVGSFLFRQSVSTSYFLSFRRELIDHNSRLPNNEGFRLQPRAVLSNATNSLSFSSTRHQA
ncbi:hypothetical protein WAI453_003990 [Rhynchosporium graminicola]